MVASVLVRSPPFPPAGCRRHAKRVPKPPIAAMTLRPVKMAVVLVLGFVLAWQGVFTASADTGANARRAMMSCCGPRCDSKHCSTPACCVRPDAPSAPVTPAALSSTSQNKLQALVVSVISLPAFPLRSPEELPSRQVLSASMTAIPLFQRDCCYLI